MTLAIYLIAPYRCLPACRGALGNCVITGDFSVQALDDTLEAFCSNSSHE